MRLRGCLWISIAVVISYGIWGGVREGEESLEEGLEIDEWGEFLVIWVFHVIVHCGRDLHRTRQTVDLLLADGVVLDELERGMEAVVGRGHLWREGADVTAEDLLWGDGQGGCCRGQQGEQPGEGCSVHDHDAASGSDIYATMA